MSVIIRPLEERDLAEADRIMRLAFGTYLNLPNPMEMFGDSDMARTRWRADPSGALAAELDGRLVGSNFAANWGSVGYFGPLSVEPELWNKGVARRLVEETVALFEGWNNRHTGLFTFPHSTKHVWLYQKFGFWPRFLTAVMAKDVAENQQPSRYVAFSSLSEEQKRITLALCRTLTDTIYEGLDLRIEITAVDVQKLGDTLLLYDGERLESFAVCHTGVGTEGGSGCCYVKFGAVRPGKHAAKNFAAMLAAVESYAAKRGLKQVEAGVNIAHIDAYRAMLKAGYRSFIQGVLMHRDNDSGYARPDVFVIDDWR